MSRDVEDKQLFIFIKELLIVALRMVVFRLLLIFVKT